MLRELAGRAGRGSFSGDARRVVSDGIRCFERIDEALVSNTGSDSGLWRTRSHGANTTNWSTGWQQRDGRLDRSVLMVDDWWKSQDRDVGRKDGKKGNRRAEAITETLAGASFDGLSSACPRCCASTGRPLWRCGPGRPGCHLNQSIGGFENGPPTGGERVTCLAHTTDMASQVSRET